MPTKPMSSQTKAKIAKSMKQVRKSGKRVTDNKPAEFKKLRKKPGGESSKWAKPGWRRDLLENTAAAGSGAITGAIVFKHPVGALVGAGLGLASKWLFGPKDKDKS